MRLNQLIDANLEFIPKEDLEEIRRRVIQGLPDEYRRNRDWPLHDLWKLFEDKGFWLFRRSYGKFITLMEKQIQGLVSSACKSLLQERAEVDAEIAWQKKTTDEKLDWIRNSLKGLYALQKEYRNSQS